MRGEPPSTAKQRNVDMAKSSAECHNQSSHILQNIPISTIVCFTLETKESTLPRTDRPRHNPTNKRRERKGCQHNVSRAVQSKTFTNELQWTSTFHARSSSSTQRNKHFWCKKLLVTPEFFLITKFLVATGWGGISNKEKWYFFAWPRKVCCQKFKHIDCHRWWCSDAELSLAESETKNEPHLQTPLFV